MEQKKWDIHKIMAILAQPKEKPEPLKNIDVRQFDISFINKARQVDQRPIKIIIPINATKPLPLIFIAHYELSEEAMEQRAYLNKGWAIASATQTSPRQNAQLTDDDLVFNNAALYTLKQMPEFDIDRIAVVGGSAGGYMALMLNALQLGICCSVANGAVSNLYFNFCKYFPEANKMNASAFSEMTPEERKDIVRNITKLPIPFIGAVSGLFLPIAANFPNLDDTNRWEAFSPVALTELFCNPILMTHATSDILVPIDQLSRRFTYDKPGDSLPGTYFHRLPKTYKGKLKYSVEERLPKAETSIRCIPAWDADQDRVLPFDEDRRFNIDIFDNGPIESYGSHSSQPGTGVAYDTAYLETMLARGAKNTNVLTLEKLQLLIERFQGKSVQLPAHEGIDDTVYGSLTWYRKEVVDALSKWKKDQGEEKLRVLFDALLDREKNPYLRLELQNVIETIKALLN